MYLCSHIGGLQQIVLPGINSTSINIKQEIFHLLGSAVQSNPKVQIAAVELGLVESLIRAVTYETEVNICFYRKNNLLSTDNWHTYIIGVGILCDWYCKILQCRKFLSSLLKKVQMLCLLCFCFWSSYSIFFPSYSLSLRFRLVTFCKIWNGKCWITIFLSR